MPSATSRRRLFVLGAYPSALHVQWSPPPGRPGGKIKAIPVDNEPEPFWNGADAAERIRRWREAEFDGTWGHIDVSPCTNGTSGQWVDSNVLIRFRLGRGDAWISDCLDTYRRSVGSWRAIEERFVPFAIDAGLADKIPRFAAHPDEDEIVAEALLPARAAALRSELRTAAPESIVTLGNAALRVMRMLVDEFVGNDPGPQLHVAAYGKPCVVSVNGRQIVWYPLAHPAAPERYQLAHESWAPE
jgi:hypothetical protein